MKSKKTLVLGASPNPTRTSWTAVWQLLERGHEVVAIGSREGRIEDVPILTGQPPLEGIHTITLYLNPTLQQPLYDYILSLKPQRIIFNPGTENPEMMRLAREKGIHTETACTLVMLSLGIY